MAKSGVRISGVKDLKTALVTVAKRASSSTFSTMLKGAKRIQDRAKKYAPVDRGHLESAIKLERVKSDVRGRVALNVGVDESTPVPERPGETVGEYAAEMHEGVYELGEKSEEKARNLGVPVGRKYLERAMKDEKPRIEREMREAIRAEARRANRRKQSAVK